MAGVRTAEGSWCDVQYAPKHPSCDTLHPVSVAINSRDENYVRSLLITLFMILLAVRRMPHADVANFGPYLSMGADQSIYMLFVLLLSSEL